MNSIIIGTLIVVVPVCVVILSAIHQKRDIRAGFKVPLASFFFEATDPNTHRDDRTVDAQTGNPKRNQ